MNVYDKYGVNIKNKQMFFYKQEDCQFDSKMMAIRAFTSTDCFRQSLYELKGYKLIKLDEDKLMLNYKGDMVEFYKFSDLLLDDSDIIRDFKNELQDYIQRQHKCHYRSLQLVNIGVGDYLVTGYVNDESGKSRIVHSWIEIGEDVLDYTSNLVMKREDYYKLMNVEVLSIINKDDVYEDSQSKFLNKLLGCKFYCLFRDEMDSQGLIQFGERPLVKTL